MNKFLQIFSVFLLTVILFTSEVLAQSFENGIISVTLSTYGRVRISGATVNERQIDRSSILVGYTADEVFDYHNDAENVDSSRTIPSPVLSDYEAYVSIDNSYNIPPFPPAAHMSKKSSAF